MRCLWKVSFVAVFCLASLANGEASHSDIGGSRRRTVGETSTTPLFFGADPCSVIRAGVGTGRVSGPVGPVINPPVTNPPVVNPPSKSPGAPGAPGELPFQPGPPSKACDEVCPERGKEELACSFQVAVDDMLFDKTATGFNECFARRTVCAEMKANEGFNPDSFFKQVCKPVTFGTGACDLKAPAVREPGDACTQGGPMTFYFEKNLQKCVAYQNLGSCTPMGAFGSLNDCETAVKAGKCQ